MSASGSERDQAEVEGGAEPPQPVHRVSPRPIAPYLSLLAAAILLPALVFSLILLDRHGRAQRGLLDTLAGATAGSISEAVDREVLGMLTTLRVLATAHPLDPSDLAVFHARARTALRGTGAHVVLLDADSRQLLNTRQPFGAPLGPPPDPTSIEAARERETAVVSNAFFDEEAQRWLFQIVMPETQAGLPARLLVMAQESGNLAQALSQRNLRGGWHVSLLDQRGIVLASSHLASDTGKPFFLGPDPGTQRISGRLGEHAELQDYSTVSQGSALTGWRVVIWSPAAVIDAPLRRSMLLLLLGGLAVAALGVGAAWVLGRTIARPIRRLAEDARRLGAGEEVEAGAYPIAEIQTVSTALAQASTERRAAENEIRFLMREVAHRSKNQLTVVSSIAKQSARNANDVAAFHDSFQKRLQGLARSTDLLLAGGVAGVELTELLAAQIEPFQPQDASRMELSGPPFRLDNQAAQTIGLAVHELATNAAKYGAFLVPTGRLVVNWCRKSDDLEIVWREHVPRLPERPETRGFGTEVIERMLGGALDARIERSFHPDGLECRFLIPLEKVRSQVAGPSGLESSVR